MKAVRKLAEKVSEGFDLPAEALAGSGKLSVTAGKRLLAENYRGLIGYEENYVFPLFAEDQNNNTECNSQEGDLQGIAA